MVHVTETLLKLCYLENFVWAPAVRCHNGGMSVVFGRAKGELRWERFPSVKALKIIYRIL